MSMHSYSWIRAVISATSHLCSSCSSLQTHTWIVRYDLAPPLSGSPSPLEVGQFHWALPVALTRQEGCWSPTQSLRSHPEWSYSLTWRHPSLQRSPPSTLAHHPETRASGKLSTFKFFKSISSKGDISLCLTFTFLYANSSSGLVDESYLCVFTSVLMWFGPEDSREIRDIGTVFPLDGSVLISITATRRV